MGCGGCSPLKNIKIAIENDVRRKYCIVVTQTILNIKHKPALYYRTV